MPTRFVLSQKPIYKKAEMSGNIRTVKYALVLATQKSMVVKCWGVLEAEARSEWGR